MKNHIFVLSRKQFSEYVKTLPEDMKKEMAFISIHEPKNKTLAGHVDAWPVILPDASNVLNLWFNDAEEYDSFTETILFDEEMANKVVEFVEANKEVKAWVLHCTMGKSRSGAVGGFLSDYFGVNYLEFKRNNPQVNPNSLVKQLLTKKLLENLTI